ncbi:hypothetical protein HKBW3S03_00446 [Candidatus Hakubella thermalkaliphila]|uniref:Uncharacterized protein n=1 Tax=Candidatus Hakubella thermalkaliphila TaxID=2754717 RepID=A0A6V8PW11_9ACTN|nr:hypothetical protein [Candidatus Hakubella thermalkaliphila]MBT9169739.1 hypothetical protein [Actinomycetota bacterium]GFP18942.1 hypothetical protein HKBW3S03_00446 [Candidatus Hakubella thermalkaliphila]GFP30516.1 hypothetical protein HKBW3S34_01436 [Candidatus Hakubella thermalkaliphila]GFP36628.1 hypothetical protein HKBW3S44_00309 [Candidatus Hakubella thermalkaliphila]GFP39009.1 hypothetical protein HKBW3S47_00709 [Candidatus Hakubella thermalkaliphila]
MKEIDVHGAARKEMSREKARIMRKKPKRTSILEQAVLEWKKRKEKERREIEERRRVQKREEMLTISLQEIIPQPRALDHKTDDAMEWRQYSPWQKEEKKEKRPLNASSIWVFARKLMAREWARALGRRREDARMGALEREAAWYKGKKEEEKKRIEEEKRGIERQKEMLEESLQVFSERLLGAKEGITAERAAELLEGTLESVGEVIEVDWIEDGCVVHIEPWEEKRLRRQRRDNLPVIYKLKIDDRLGIVSYGRITGDIPCSEKPKIKGN